jgi:hypothetical protein
VLKSRAFRHAPKEQQFAAVGLQQRGDEILKQPMHIVRRNSGRDAIDISGGHGSRSSLDGACNLCAPRIVLRGRGREHVNNVGARITSS